MVRTPCDSHMVPLIGKMSGACVFVEAPKGSVARVLRWESSSTTQGKPCMGVGVGHGAIRRRGRLKIRKQTGRKPVSISTQSSRGDWVGSGDHVPCGREPRRLDGWTLIHRPVVLLTCFCMCMHAPFKIEGFCIYVAQYASGG